MRAMQASFIIPLFNGLAFTRECLRTLRATLPAGLEHEVILVDDGSTDGTRDWLATLAPPCRVLLNAANAGFATTCNRGAAAATGELLVFLNNDLELLPGWYAPLAALARRPGAGVVGNVQRDARTGRLDHTGIRFNERGKPEHARRLWPSALLPGPLTPWPWGSRRVAAVTGACFAIRRATWVGLGGFDPAFVNGGEDLDLCFRARAAGLRNAVALRSVVRHHISQSPGRKRHDERNSFLLARRWRSLLERLSARACSQVYLDAHWEEPRDFPRPTDAFLTFLFRHRLWPAAPAGARDAAADALAVELARWNGMFPAEAAPVAPPAPRPPRGPHRPVV